MGTKLLVVIGATGAQVSLSRRGRSRSRSSPQDLNAHQLTAPTFPRFLSIFLSLMYQM